MGQLGWIELPEAYGLTQANASQSLTAAGLTEAQAQAKFPKYWARLQFEGKPVSKLMATNFGVCAAQDAFWVGHVHSFANVPFPAGSGNIQFGPVSPMVANNSMWMPYGRMQGVGTFGDKRYNTVIHVDHDNWQGDPLQKHLFLAPSFGRTGSSSYHESAEFGRFRLYGAKKVKYNDPSYQSSGLVLWDEGEASEVGIVKADFFNDFGVMCVRGTPAVIGNLSAFCNGLGALGLVGTSKANITVKGVISGDDNLVLINMLPGFDRPAGCGSLVVLNLKCESATYAEGGLGAAHGYTGQGVAYLRGQFNATIIGSTISSTWVKAGQMFWVDDRIDGVPQNSRLEAKGNSYGYGAILIDSRRGTWYSPPADHSDWHMEYLTQDGTLRINGVLQTPQSYPVGAGPMGFARNGETLNYANATPQQGQQVSGGTTPPPQPIACTGWETGAWGAWGPCVNGQQTRTRTVTATPAGCTGTPPNKPAESETQACTTPPPSGNNSVTNVVVTTNGMDLVPDWANVKTLTFEGFTATGSTLGGYLAGWDVSGQTLRGLKVGADGSVYENSQGFNETSNKLPAGTVKLGVPATFTFTLKIPRTVKHLGGWPNTANGQPFTATKVSAAQ